ncbi:4-alpha-glucanotransferase [Stenotrophomonas maltophilia]|uniref:4-alpha-glucanotransferase n=1 Tax=Stenotrophomonas maltophilia TaxID=40324 RepID=UPI0021C7CEF2|nr:4-alpha-glucanotransferase [Stenotrophomonas maltophilia]MCU1020271.1 4-alpha-glucanotransferase [Stenotrophomonas maltophilia]
MRTDTSVRDAARRAGLLERWTDVAGVEREVAPDVLRAVLEGLHCDGAPVRARLLTACYGQVLVMPEATGAACWVDEQGRELPARPDAQGRWRVPDQPGYWQWRQGGRQQAVAVAPPRAWWPPRMLRGWGLSAQVYSLRARGDAGIGDSAGCTRWRELLHRHGGDALALSPLHAGLPPGPGYSPYSPSDRRWLDPLQVSLPQVLPEAADSVLRQDEALAMAIDAATAARRIDWPHSAALKWRWMRQVRHWLRQQAPAQCEQIETWCDAQGEPLLHYCQHAADGITGSADDHAFAQWLAQQGWVQVHAALRSDGASIGLIADLAVGCAPQGVEARTGGADLLQGLELGAPPDAFNPLGQAWGITSWSPLALHREGFAPFIRVLRAVMAGRGGLRIDHILGLQRLWVLPHGAGAGQGVYLRYPFDDLINLLVLESWRHRCVLIGEDLGVVPPGIRQRLAARGILGIEVLPFARNGERFLPASRWRRDAVAMPSTHDLPPLAGWLRGRDLRWRARLGELEDLPAALRARARDVQALAAVCGGGGATVEDGALSLVAHAASRLALLPLEDVLGSRAQVNLPGTVSGHPNWRRRLPLAWDGAAADARLARLSSTRRRTGP